MLTPKARQTCSAGVFSCHSRPPVVLVECCDGQSHKCHRLPNISSCSWKAPRLRIRFVRVSACRKLVSRMADRLPLPGSVGRQAWRTSAAAAVRLPCGDTLLSRRGNWPTTAAQAHHVNERAAETEAGASAVAALVVFTSRNQLHRADKSQQSSVTTATCGCTSNDVTGSPTRYAPASRIWDLAVVTASPECAACVFPAAFALGNGVTTIATARE